MSRTGYVIKYTVCTVLWCSKLQTEIALSSLEVEYIALSQVLHEVIPFVAFMKEACFILYVHLPNPEVFCKVFKDNQSCISIVEANKF